MRAGGGLLRVAGWLAFVCVGTAVARAERPRPTKINAAHLVQRAPHALPVEPSSRLIYVRRCPDTGCIVKFGPVDDSRTDTSQIASGTRVIGKFSQSESVWQETMACVKATYAPFDIEVTDVDPGDVPHYEHLVGGKPNDLRDDLGSNTGGVSPFTCTEIPNAISYTFDVWGPDPSSLCYVIAQETAHAFGLEHEMNNRDPLTYLTGPMPKRFQAADAPCGEFHVRACECGGTTQNTYEHILAMFGPGDPTPPTVAIASPSSGKVVQPGFKTRIDAVDDVAIDRVELYIDEHKVGETADAPYVIAAPVDLAEGPHSIVAVAYDVQGTLGKAAPIDVELGPPCTASAGCTGDDVCVDGLCVAGPDMAGGLGYFCQADTECLSNQCLADGSGDRFCVEACDLGDPGSCPSGFACTETSAFTGVCWPEQAAGCCSTGSGAGGPMFLGGGLLALLLRRRRRATSVT